jgi:signal peptide peptidase SppA
MSKYAHIAARMFNRPLLVEPGKLGIMYGILAARIGLEGDRADVGDPGNGPAPAPAPMPDDMNPDDQIAVINVTGSLVNRMAMEPLSSFASYERIRGRLARAAADGKNRGILLRFESYGGEVAGVWDLADSIRALRGQIPVWASVDDNAFSAAYALASQTDRIYVTRTSGVGSVGVIALHWDYSAWLKDQGIKPTAVFAGAHKIDFAPWQPMADDTESWLRGSVDREYARFVEYVAAGRKMSAGDVRATEAALYEGADGIKIGFADAQGTFDLALAEFAAELRSKAGSRGGSAAKGSRGGKMEFTHTLVDVNAAKESGVGEGRKLERARWAAILGCDEAKGRGNLALTIAGESDMDVEGARKILAAAPVQTETKGSPLAGAMALVPNPKVGADGGDDADDAAAEARKTVAAYKAAQGVK